jgi:hypothetical protein
MKSGTQWWVGFAPNITLLIQDKKFMYLPIYLQYYFSANRMHVLEYFLFCTGFLLFTLSFMLLLRSNDVVDPSSILSQPLKSVTLASWWNPRGVSFLSGNWFSKGTCIFVVTGWYWYSVQLITAPCSKGYSMSAFYTLLPIGALLCKT